MSHATVPTTIPFILYEGQSITPRVGTLWPAALNGHELPLDIESDQWRHFSIPLLRQQADQSERPSERSLNPEALWRRAQDCWHKGAGQHFMDHPVSDQHRFNRSRGIDIWTMDQLSLLPDTGQKRSSTNANLRLEVAGSRLYLTDGSSSNSNLFFTTDITVGSPTWTAVTGGTPAVAANAITSDGFNVYVAFGSSGVWKTDTSSTTAASFVTGTVGGVLKYVKGRLMASNNNSIYNITGSGALPAALYTHPNTDFKWVGFAAGPSHIFAAGYSGDKSLIYAIAIKPDGTALEIPTFNRDLPDGEVVTSIDSYLGFILLGTTKGARFCLADADGNLSIGPSIPTTTACRAFEGQDRYVWFGWSNYDVENTGLGRMNLTLFTESIETGARVPAYASDLMVSGQGSILSIVTFQDKRVFTIEGRGVYAEVADLVSSGYIDSGVMNYGLPDHKIAMFLDVRTRPLEGSYTAFLAVDASHDAASLEFEAVGSETAQGSLGRSFPVDQKIGERFEIRLVLTRSSTDATMGPIVTRYTLKSLPGAVDGFTEFIQAPFLLHDVVDLNGREVHLDVQVERDHIKQLRVEQIPVVYQEPGGTYNVVVTGYEWIPYNYSQKAGVSGFGVPNGTMVTQMKRVY